MASQSEKTAPSRTYSGYDAVGLAAYGVELQGTQKWQDAQDSHHERPIGVSAVDPEH
jgi:hypothetical protein